MSSDDDEELLCVRMSQCFPFHKILLCSIFVLIFILTRWRFETIDLSSLGWCGPFDLPPGTYRFFGSRYEPLPSGL